MHDNGAWFNTTLNSSLLQVDILQETKDSSWVLGHSVIWPRLEVEVVDGPPLSILIYIVDQELSKDVVRVGYLTNIHHMDLVKRFTVLFLWPVAGALVLETEGEKEL